VDLTCLAKEIAGNISIQDHHTSILVCIADMDDSEIKQYNAHGFQENIDETNCGSRHPVSKQFVCQKENTRSGCGDQCGKKYDKVKLEKKRRLLFSFLPMSVFVVFHKGIVPEKKYDNQNHGYESEETEP
jgi:hypothetical protein